MFVLLFCLSILAVIIVSLASQWKLFARAGLPGWGAIVPFFNVFLLMLMTWGNGWLMFVMFIPGANVVFGVATYIKLAKVFGKGAGYGIAMLFFPIIFLPLLAFGNNRYEGASATGMKASAVISGIVFLIWVVLTGIVISLGLTTSILSMSMAKDNLQNPQKVLSQNYDYNEKKAIEDVHNEDYKPVIDETPYDSELIELDNGIDKYQIPFVKTDACTIEGNMAIGSKNGTNVEIVYETVKTINTREDMVTILNDRIAQQVSIVESMPDSYANPKVSQLIQNSDINCQQTVSYLNRESGETCYRGVKVINNNGYAVIITVEGDPSNYQGADLDHMDHSFRMYDIMRF